MMKHIMIFYVDSKISFALTQKPRKPKIYHRKNPHEEKYPKFCPKKVNDQFIDIKVIIIIKGNQTRKQIVKKNFS